MLYFPIDIGAVNGFSLYFTVLLSVSHLTQTVQSHYFSSRYVEVPFQGELLGKEIEMRSTGLGGSSFRRGLGEMCIFDRKNAVPRIGSAKFIKIYTRKRRFRRFPCQSTVSNHAL